MKKIFFWILGIFTIFFLLFGQSFAVTLSFIAKDGSVFCETNTFDGQYKLCSTEQKSSSNLGKSWRYGPQIVETPKAKICIEKGREIDESVCRIKIYTDAIVVNTGILIKNQSGSENISQTGNTVVLELDSTGSTATDTNTIINTNTGTAASPTIYNSDSTDKVNVSNVSDIIQSLRTSFLACIWTIPDTACAIDSSRIMKSVESIGIYFVWWIFLFVCFCCIFWWIMFIHALWNPGSYKVVWILIILIFSIFGATIYHFRVRRPYIAAQLALLPPKPPSFFD